MVYQAHHDTIDYRTIYDKRLPVSFNDFCVFFISDIHRRNIKKYTLQSIKGEIDVIIIGGDITEKGVPLERTKRNIKKFKKWNLPIYFIWGNNDYEEHPKELFQLLVTEGVTVLANTNKNISVKGQVISLIGLDCCKYNEANLEVASESANGDYTILLTHDPSAFYELEDTEQQKVHTVLAGHTHGGQIRFFGLGFYQKGGLHMHHHTNVLVSEGYGYTTLPFRFGTKAECHVLIFKNKH